MRRVTNNLRRPDESPYGVASYAIWHIVLELHGKIADREEVKEKSQKPAVYPDIQDNFAMARRVEEGLPVVDVVHFGKLTGFTNDELARLIQVPPRTYARRVANKSRLKVHESERAARLMRVYDRAKQLFVTDENTRGWFHAKIPALGGRTPLEYAQTEPGAREVENVIGRIEHGIVM